MGPHSTAFLWARDGLPGYTTVTEQMPEIWNARYPAPVESFEPDAQLRALRVIDGGRYVYYYHFTATVLRTQRAAEGTEMTTTGRRPIEVWARYRPWLPAAERWDVSLVRGDLLPGSNRSWITVGQ